MTWRQIADRSHGHIEKLADGFRQRVTKWYHELTLKKIPVLIYCSVRTPMEQDELYAQGRTKKGAKVTNARGTPVPQSFHCYGRAIDAVPCSLSSTGQGYVTSFDDEKGYQLLRNCAEKYAMRWLSWETPHFEDANFKDWRELAAKDGKAVATNAPQSTKPLRSSSRLSPSTSRKVGLRKP